MNIPLTEEPEQPSRAKMELREQQLRQKIAQGLDSLQRGEGVDGDGFFAQLEREETAFSTFPAA